MKFIKTMKLVKNVTLKGFTTLTRNAIMTCYITYLIIGHVLLYKCIKSGIISKYRSAAADLSKPAQMMNLTIDIVGNQSHPIKDIIYEYKRWESIPNRHEPVTKDMIGYLIDKGAKKYSDNHFVFKLVLEKWNGIKTELMSIRTVPIKVTLMAHHLLSSSQIRVPRS